MSWPSAWLWSRVRNGGSSGAGGLREADGRFHWEAWGMWKILILRIPPPCFLLRGVCHRCFVLGVCRSVSNKCRVKGELKCWAKIYWIPAHTHTHVKGDAQTHRSTRVNYKDVTFLGYKYLQMCIHNLGCKRKNMRKV